MKHRLTKKAYKRIAKEKADKKIYREVEPGVFIK